MTVLRETTIFSSSVLFLVLKIISYNHSPTPNIHEVSQTLWVLLASQALGPQSLQEKSVKLRRTAQYGASHMALVRRAPRPGLQGRRCMGSLQPLDKAPSLRQLFLLLG